MEHKNIYDERIFNCKEREEGAPLTGPKFYYFDNLKKSLKAEKKLPGNLQSSNIFPGHFQIQVFQTEQLFILSTKS